MTEHGIFADETIDRTFGMPGGREYGRVVGFALALVLAVVMVTSGCSASTPEASPAPSSSPSGAPTTASSGANGSPTTPSSAGAGGIDNADAFCVRLAAGAVEVSRRLKAGAKVTDPDYQAYTARTNAEVLAAAPADVKAALTVVYGVAESVRTAAGSGGDPGAAAAASKSPEFKTASANYIAWVKKNCTAEQNQQIVGAG